MDIIGKAIEITEEARVLTGLNHPNIIKYVDSFRDGNFYSIVTEYCEVCVYLIMINVFINFIFKIERDFEWFH